MCPEILFLSGNGDTSFYQILVCSGKIWPMRRVISYSADEANRKSAL